MKSKKDHQFIVKISKSEKHALQRLAAERDIPASQIVRQAIKSAIAEAGIDEEKA